MAGWMARRNSIVVLRRTAREKKKHIVGGEDVGKVYSNLVEVCR